MKATIVVEKFVFAIVKLLLKTKRNELLFEQFIHMYFLLL